MWSMLRLSLAVCVAIAEETAFDDDSLSLLQSRALQHHQPAQHQVRSGDDELGHEVKDRPLVDENKCDKYTVVDGRNVLSEGICPMEFKDHTVIPRTSEVAAQVVTGVRFFVKQAGNFGLRFLVYRNNGKLSEQTEEIDVPVAGVIQEYTFKQPLFLMYNDIVGWIHNGHGNMPYSEGSAEGVVMWDGASTGPGFNGKTQIWQEEQHGTCGLFQTTPTTLHRRHVMGKNSPGAFEKRTYSYSLIVRPAAKADVPEKMCLNELKPQAPPQSLLDSLPDEAPLPDPEPPLPDAAEGDAAAAVADPHLTTNEGERFDLQ